MIEYKSKQKTLDVGSIQSNGSSERPKVSLRFLASW